MRPLTILRLRLALIFSVLLVSAIACNTRGAQSMGSHSNPFTDDYKSSVSGLPDDFSQGGLKNALNAMDGVNPEFENLLPKDLLDEVADQLGDSSPEAMAQNSLLFSKLMQYCTNAAIRLAPRPGEPLLGEWRGSCEKKKNVDTSGLQSILSTLGGALASIPEAGGYIQMGLSAVSSIVGLMGKEANKPTYENISFIVAPKYEDSLQGHSGSSVLQTENRGFDSPLPLGDVILSAKGENIDVTVAVDGTGRGAIIADNSASSGRLTTIGNLKDVPFAGTAEVAKTELRNGKKGAATNCKDVKLAESHNPIPRKVVEAYKQVGNCMRPAIMLLSPAVGRMFGKLPPHVALSLKQGMLGIQ